jgi:hypothetical protein
MLDREGRARLTVAGRVLAPFSRAGYCPLMSKEAPPADARVVPASIGTTSLRPADPADLMQALAFALRYRGRKRVDSAGEIMAQITTERLVDTCRLPDLWS